MYCGHAVCQTVRWIKHEGLGKHSEWFTWTPCIARSTTAGWWLERHQRPKALVWDLFPWWHSGSELRGKHSSVFSVPDFLPLCPPILIPIPKKTYKHVYCYYILFYKGPNPMFSGCSIQEKNLRFGDKSGGSDFQLRECGQVTLWESLILCRVGNSLHNCCCKVYMS